jgi:hypothetical protein
MAHSNAANPLDRHSRASAGNRVLEGMEENVAAFSNAAGTQADMNLRQPIG